MTDLLLEKWGSLIVTGDKKVERKGLLGFRNSVPALEILRKHILMNSRIAVHCDVDLDGVGNGYIAKSFLKSQGAVNTLFIINKEKEHGIQQKHVDYFNDVNKADLIIILDSSTNEVNIAKGFKSDVLIVDHHEVLHKDIYGKTNDGKHEYVIVNNMLGNSEVGVINEWLRKNNPNTTEILTDYVAEERMSGAMTLYELLSIYCEVYKTGPVLENLMLYQWVGVTLFSDAILLVPDRNQWFIENTVHSMYVESCLAILLQELNKYKATMDKSFINYTLAPVINKAIRAGFSGLVLDIVLNRPRDIGQLQIYKEMQKASLESCILENEHYPNDYIMKDITNKTVSLSESLLETYTSHKDYIMQHITAEKVSKNYCGVIASRLCGDNNKNSIIFIMHGDIAQGSFRGRRSGVDYRKFFESYDSDIYAQGHKGAFGFKVNISMLETIMSKLSSIESEATKYYLTAGKVPEDAKGTHHIDDMLDFKKQGYFWRLAVANSKLSSDEKLDIVTSSAEAVMLEPRGKLFMYDVLGICCKSFEPINTKLIAIYIEYSKNIEMYVKNINI